MDAPQERVKGALFVFVRQIARMLIRAGVGYNAFAEIAKSAFVSVAFEDFGLRGRKTSVSRVAALTGISRREVARVNEKLHSALGSETDKLTSPSILIQEWRTNSNYVDASGKPLPLLFEKGPNSFCDLVKISVSDIPPGALKTELKRSGCVREEKDGRLILLRDYYLDTNLNGRLAMAFRNQLRLHAATVMNNTQEETQDSLMLEKVVYTTKLSAADAQNFRRVSHRELEGFASRYAQLIDGYDRIQAHSESTPNRDGQVAGIGFYYFED